MNQKYLIFIGVLCLMMSCQKDDQALGLDKTFESSKRSVPPSPPPQSISDFTFISEVMVRDPNGIEINDYINAPAITVHEVTNTPTHKVFTQSIDVPSGSSYSTDNTEIQNPTKILDESVGPDFEYNDNILTFTFEDQVRTEEIPQEFITKLTPTVLDDSPFDDPNSSDPEGPISFEKNLINLTSIGYTVEESSNEYVFTSPSLGVDNATGQVKTMLIYVNKATEMPTKSVMKVGDNITQIFKHDDIAAGEYGTTRSIIRGQKEIVKTSLIQSEKSKKTK